MKSLESTENYFNECKVEFLNIRGGDIPDDEYFKIKAVSNSKLNLIDPYRDGSPQLFRDGLKFKYDPSLALGSAVHCLFLQNNDFILSNYDGKPSAKLGLFIDYVYDFRKKGYSIQKSINEASIKADYYVGKMTSNRIKDAINKGLDYYLRKLHGKFNSDKEVIVLCKSQLDNCKSCLNSLKRNFEISKLFKDNLFERKEIINEFALLCDIKVTLPVGVDVIIPFKGKVDNIIVDPESNTIYLNDLKTTSKQMEYFMGGEYEGEFYEGSFQKLSYYRQLGIYMMLTQMYFDYIRYMANYNYKCNIILVETTGENRSKLCRISNSYILEGLKEFKELICRVAYHEIYGYDREFTGVIN